MFKVERIILKDFVGMGLRDIALFDLTITSDVLIILGGNGCGKTSLLNVFFPVCPPKEDFIDGGSYTNYSFINNTRYLFEVKRIDDSLKCSITNLTTGTVLINNVNPKVYNSNIENILGITRDLKILINGERTLTAAATAERRNWFTKLSTTDLGYALSFYNRLKSKSSNIKGAISHTTHKIAEIKKKVIESETDREALKERLETLQKQIDIITVGLKNAPKTDNRVTNEHIKELLNKSDKLADFLIKNIKVTDTNLKDGERSLWYSNNGLLSDIQNLDVAKGMLSDAKDKIQQQEFLLKNYTGLETEIKSLTNELSVISNKVKLFKFTNPNNELEEALKEFHSFNKSLAHYIDSLLDNESLKSVNTKLKDNENKLIKLKHNLVVFESKLNELNNSLTKIMETNSVECPECNTVFKPGIYLNPDDLKIRISEQQNIINITKDQIDTLEVLLPELTAKKSNLENIKNLMLSYSKHPVINILFKTLNEHQAFSVNRAKAGSLIGAFENDLIVTINVNNITKRLDEANTNWEQVVILNNNIDNELPNKILELEKEYETCLDAVKNQELVIKGCNDYIDYCNKYINLANSFKTIYKTLDDDLKTFYNNMAVNAVEKERSLLWDTYSAASERFRVMQQELNTLKELELELVELQLESKNISKAIVGFSPEKGVLRKYFFNSIVRITELMTHYISKVWNHDLKVLPCDMGDSDLDYNFPYLLKSDANPVSDISRGSRAQKEMFDLSFRLTAYKALNLKEFPILLDEPGAAFDETHRNIMVEFIKGLTSSGEFSQALVVSHNTEIHSKLYDAKYVVIDSEGISLPEVYNEDVIIQYK